MKDELERLKQEIEEFKEWVNTFDTFVGKLDPHGVMIFCNEAPLKVAGIKKEDVYGKYFPDTEWFLHSSKEREKVKEAIQKAKSGLPSRREITIKAKDGLIPVIFNCQPVIKEGKLKYITIEGKTIVEEKRLRMELQEAKNNLEKRVRERTAELLEINKKLKKEISERKQAEEALAAEKERLAITLRSIGDGVIATNNKGEIILINKIAEKLTGWSQDEAIGRPLNEVFYIINERTRKPYENFFEKVIKADSVVSLSNDTILIARDGTERVIADSSAPIRDKDGNIIGVILVFRDITEERKLEQELIKADKLESIGILAGGIAHDFNNILTAILGNISLAEVHAKSEEKVVERLEKAKKACLRGRDLVQQLLTFSKGGEPIKKVTSIAKLIKESVNFALSGSNVKCEFSIPDDLWLVEIDEGQINQVINNLIINAVQAMPEGGIIEVSCENTIITEKDNFPFKKGKYVKITIKDKGVGIPKEHLPKIFDPFFTTKEKGTGLGLATTYSIIKKHDGYIELKSEVGVGTTFYIYLPAKPLSIPFKQGFSTNSYY